MCYNIICSAVVEKAEYGALAQLVERTNRTLSPSGDNPRTVFGETAQKSPVIFGAIAQLVARYIRIVEVTGSNPVSSTTSSPSIGYNLGEVLFYHQKAQKPCNHGASEPFSF